MIGKMRAFGIDVNPEPWVIPPFYPARTGKKITVRAGQDQGLHAYQEAVREQIMLQDPEMLPGPYGLKFYFNVDLAKYTAASGKAVTENIPDNTNLQKAIEDALQGVVIGNDRDVVFNQSSRRISPAALAIVEVYYELEDYPDISTPQAVKALLDLNQRRALRSIPSENEWPPRGTA